MYMYLLDGPLFSKATEFCSGLAKMQLRALFVANSSHMFYGFSLVISLEGAEMVLFEGTESICAAESDLLRADTFNEPVNIFCST
jgi:hypothetical protein